MAITMAIFIRGITVLAFTHYALQFCSGVCAVQVAKCCNIATLHYPFISSQHIAATGWKLWQML
jgi:hypothetical protein